MEPEALGQWIGRVYSTQEEELDCQETQDRLPAYVEAEIEEQALDPMVTVHLAQCPDCYDTYAGLRYVVDLAESGQLEAGPEETTYATAPDGLTAVAGS